jgi:hypothetical protein
MSKMVQTSNSSSSSSNNNNISISVDKRAGTTAQVPIASTITQVQHKYTKTKKGTQKTQEKSSKFNNNSKKQQYQQSTMIKAPYPRNIDTLITEYHQLV